MRATVALLCLFFLASDAGAEAKISDLAVAIANDQVLASLSLEGAFDRRLAERVASGLPTAILYRFELHRDRKRWYDRHLESSTLEVVAMYDAVARQYTVNSKLDGELVESRTLHDRDEVAQAMTRVENLPVFAVTDLPRRLRLLVKARAELGSRMILALIPATIATDWAESRKFRAPAGPP